MKKNLIKASRSDIKRISDEILEMAKLDQSLRNSLTLDWKKINTLDKRNQKKVKKIVRKYGIISPKIFGKDVAHAAWLIVQHSAQDGLAFMEQYLLTMKSSYDEFDPYDVARMTDRVEIYKGKGQIYGTGLVSNGDSKVLKFRPIKDIKNVDKRRKSIGLNTLAEYAKEYENGEEKIELPEGYEA